MSAEEDKLLDHDFDGIQEYDNPMPRWWLGLFFITIIIAFVYFPYFHFFGGKLPHELYQEESTQIASIRQVAETKRKEREKIRQAELAKARKEQAAARASNVTEGASVTEVADQESEMTRKDWGFEGDLEEGA